MLAKKVETLTKAMEVEAKKMRREVAAMEKEVAAMRVDKDQDNRAKRSSNTKPSSNTAQILAARYLTMLNIFVYFYDQIAILAIRLSLVFDILQSCWPKWVNKEYTMR